MGCRHPSTTALRELGPIWAIEKIRNDWCELVSVTIYKKDDRSSCENHRGISLIIIASKLLLGVILRSLFSARERCVREIQIGPQLHRVVLTKSSFFDKSKNIGIPSAGPFSVFLDLKARFSVAHAALRCSLVEECAGEIHFTYTIFIRVCGYDHVLSEFTTKSGAR